MSFKPPEHHAVLKVVLDTNVLVSGIIASGYSSTIVDAAQRGQIQLITSTSLLQEFSEVITRRHIVRKYPLVVQMADILLDFLRAFAIFVPGIPRESVSSDQDDDFVLACARDGQANCIVSGDPDLLDLQSYRGIPILTPRAFVETKLQ